MSTRKRIRQTMFPTVIAVSVVLLLTHTLVDANGTILYETYRAFIASAIEQARDARSQSPKTCAVTLERIAAQIESVKSVRMPDGTLMRVAPCCGIDEALRAAPCNAERAEAFLRGLCPGCTNVQINVIVTNQGPGVPGQPPGARQTSSVDLGEIAVSQAPDGPGQAPDSPGQAGDQSTAGSNLDQPQSDDGSTAGSDDSDPSSPGDNTQPGGQGSGDDGPGDKNTSDDGASQPPGEGSPGDGQTDNSTPTPSPPGNEQPGGQQVDDDSTQPAGDGDDDRALSQDGDDGTLSQDGSGQSATRETDQGNPTRPPAGTTPSLRPDRTTPAQTLTPPAQTLTPPAQNEQTPRWRTALVWLLIAVGVLALVIGLVLLWMLWGRKEPEQEKEPGRPQAIPAPEKAIDRAEQLIAAGDYRGAVRYLVLAVLAILHQKGRLDFDRSLTNRELLHIARQDPVLAEPLAVVVHTFDTVWYGFEPIAPPDYAVLVDKIELLKQL